MKNIFYGPNCAIASICITLSPFLDASILASAAPLVTQQNKFTQPDFAQHFRDLGEHFQGNLEVDSAADHPGDHLRSPNHF
ncbi:MAG: hypothetical protein AAF329_13025, partial [Cyanobacteria bacterium P01_A01_bin.17]